MTKTKKLIKMFEEAGIEIYDIYYKPFLGFVVRRDFGTESKPMCFDEIVDRYRL